MRASKLKGIYIVRKNEVVKANERYSASDNEWR